MSADALSTVKTHWGERHRIAMAAVDSARRDGRPALQHLRQASRCEARLNKLEDLLARISAPRGQL